MVALAQNTIQTGLGDQYFSAWSATNLTADSVPLARLVGITPGQFAESIGYSWTNFTNFPSGCAAGSFVSTIGLSLTCGTPASATPRYVVTQATSSLADETVIPDHIVLMEEFYGDAVQSNPSILGTESRVSEAGRFGIRNYASAASAASDAGVSLGESATTNLLLYNYSKLRHFGATFRFAAQPTNITGQRTAVGLIGTNGTAATLGNYTGSLPVNINNSIMFWMNNTVTPTWQTATCANKVCTLTNTTNATTANWVKFDIFSNGNAGWAAFYINDTLVANHTANIPMNYSGDWIGAWTENLNATAENIRLDYIFYEALR